MQDAVQLECNELTLRKFGAPMLRFSAPGQSVRPPRIPRPGIDKRTTWTHAIAFNAMRWDRDAPANGVYLSAHVEAGCHWNSPVGIGSREEGVNTIRRIYWCRSSDKKRSGGAAYLARAFSRSYINLYSLLETGLGTNMKHGVGTETPTARGRTSLA